MGIPWRSDVTIISHPGHLKKKHLWIFLGSHNELERSTMLLISVNHMVNPLSMAMFNSYMIFHNIWDNPSHWLRFFKMVKTTNQLQIFLIRSQNMVLLSVALNDDLVWAAGSQSLAESFWWSSFFWCCWVLHVLGQPPARLRCDFQVIEEFAEDAGPQQLVVQKSPKTSPEVWSSRSESLQKLCHHLVGGDWNIGEMYGIMMVNDG